LKPDKDHIAPLLRKPFRGHLAAASLKQRRRDPREPAGLGFPRPFGRGLIEARCWAQYHHGDESFPRPFGRGLIEAASTDNTPAGLMPFPRPFGRGLIEAAFSAYAA
jgi:hypothetical protein